MRRLKLACLILFFAVLPARAGVLDEKASQQPVIKCGGYIGDVCGTDQWCDFPDDAPCGIGRQGEVLGVCRLRRPICGRIYMPVCGCNGKTYGNSCEAKAGGTDVLHMGKCLEAGGEK